MGLVPVFSLSRFTHVDADPARVHDLVDDLRQWQQWSPWEGLDPDVQREYDGPRRGVGSRYAWRGNSKAGQGSMEITQSCPSRVTIDLRFLKPFSAQNLARFDLAPARGGADVTWTMTGQRNRLMAVLGRLFFDKQVGKDFERGLAALRRVAES